MSMTSYPALSGLVYIFEAYILTGPFDVTTCNHRSIKGLRMRGTFKAFKFSACINAQVQVHFKVMCTLSEEENRPLSFWLLFKQADLPLGAN